MMRFTFLAMAPAVMANHLKGPMQDQLDACTAANCPDSKVFFEAANFDGTGMSFNTFVGPNNAKWIGDVDYVLKVIGNNQVPYDYVASGEQNGEIFCEEGALAKDQQGCEAASCCEWCGTLSTFRSRIASGY